MHVLILRDVETHVVMMKRIAICCLCATCIHVRGVACHHVRRSSRVERRVDREFLAVGFDALRLLPRLVWDRVLRLWCVYVLVLLHGQGRLRWRGRARERG